MNFQYDDLSSFCSQNNVKTREEKRERKRERVLLRCLSSLLNSLSSVFSCVKCFVCVLRAKRNDVLLLCVCFFEDNQVPEREERREKKNKKKAGDF